MSFKNYIPDNIATMFFSTYKVKPYVYDNTFSLLEMVSQALEKVNEVITESNDMGQAIVLFEQYVKQELTSYDDKITNEVNEMLTTLINDGTIANLINTTLFNNINLQIENNNNSIETINTEIYELNYKKPVATLSINPNRLIYEKGETVNGMLLNVVMNKQTEFIKNVKYYKNDVLINSRDFTIETPTDSFIDGNNITNTTKYHITFSDDKTTVTSDKIEIDFVSPFYHGVIENSVPVISDISLLTKDLTLKGNKEHLFTGTDKKVVFAYPSEYGYLSSIQSDEEHNMLSGFDVVQLTINSVLYNVYYSKNKLFINNFKIKFVF